VEGAARRILELLEERERLQFRDLFPVSAPAVDEVVSALLALLELARVGRLRIAQECPFGALIIAREPALAAV
jgi:chromatin segregation and condensation protein Rec8/ScpA/Scc1 (kleisin family)